MGYFNIFDIFENLNWRKFSHMEGDELVVDREMGLVCPHCLREIKKARLLSSQTLRCVNCRREIWLPEG
jgi:hypothetical protein